MTEGKTLGDLAIAAYCAVLDEGTDSMNVASDLEDHEIRGLRAAASAVREKVIEECAVVAYAHQNTEGEAIAQELLGKICAMNGHKWGELVGGLLHGMRMCTDCGAVLEDPPTSGDRTELPQDQRLLETNLIHPHPRQDGQQCDHPIAGDDA